MGNLVAIARVSQFAIEFEGPGVVGAGDDVAGLAAALEQFVTPVGADVVEGPQHRVPAPDHDDVLADQFAGDVVIGFGHFAAMGDADPLLRKDALFLEFEHALCGVVGAGQGPAVFRVVVLLGVHGGDVRRHGVLLGWGGGGWGGWAGLPAFSGPVRWRGPRPWGRSAPSDRPAGGRGLLAAT